MKCQGHVYKPLYRSPFHVVEGAAWAVEYCRCGEPQWHVINPNQPAIEEDQPAYVTHAALARAFNALIKA